VEPRCPNDRRQAAQQRERVHVDGDGAVAERPAVSKELLRKAAAFFAKENT
jgi:hypothetical protein